MTAMTAIAKKSSQTSSSSVKPDLILAIDQGTTGTTAMVVNQRLEVLGVAGVEFRQIYPQSGWVEHDLNDIWASTLNAIKTVLIKSKAQNKRIAAIGITNQRETVCFWSRKTGKPLGNAIVWQDRRTSALCDDLRKKGHEALVSSKTGLLLDPYFSGTKINWALNHRAAVREASKKEDLCFGTIDSFLIHKLTNGAAHVTEASNASRTLLFNLETLTWDDGMLKLFNIPRHILPEVLDSAGQFGITSGVAGLPDGIPITGVLGDQQAALLGQACILEGMAKCTYGTGSFILLNTGSKIRRSSHRQLSTVAWKFKGVPTYALEGGAFTAGAAVQWMRDGLGVIKNSAEIQTLASKVKDNGGVVFVPAFAGLGSPHWSAEARAAFFGLSRGSTKHHMARAVLEGIAFMNYDILHAMQKDLGVPIRALNVDGGASKNELLMQFQADILKIELTRPRLIETTALGAIFAAGLGIGFWADLSDVKKSWKKDKTFKPKMNDEKRSHLLNQWNLAVGAVKKMHPA